MDRPDPVGWEADFEREIMADDGSEADAILASGQPIHIAYEDTPDGYVVRVHPDGREELVYVDPEALAKTLGS